MSCCKRSLPKTILVTLALTVVSVFLSLIATGMVSYSIARKGKLKACLKTLFPQHEWEFTGIYTHFKHICFTVFYPDGFDPISTDAEAKTREMLLQNSPGLAKLRFKVAFLPMSDFRKYHGGKV